MPGKFGHQTSCQGGGGEPAVVSRGNRRPHRLHLLLHQAIDLMQRFLVDPLALQAVGAGDDERPRIRAGKSDSKGFDHAVIDRERDRHAGEWIVDCAADPHLGVG